MQNPVLTAILALRAGRITPGQYRNTMRQLRESMSDAAFTALKFDAASKS